MGFFKSVAAWYKRLRDGKQLPGGLKLPQLPIVVFDPPHRTDKELNDGPFKRGQTVVLLGEIAQMPGHVVVATRNGKVISGWHDDNFRLPREDEI